jgi:hypothetical protein
LRAIAALAALLLAAAPAAQAADARLAMPIRKAPATSAPRQALQPMVNRTIYSLPNYQIVIVTSASNTQPDKSVSGACPAGMKAMSGSANARSTYPEPTASNNDDGVSVGLPVSLFGYPRSMANVESGPTDEGNGWAASGRLPVVNSDWLIELTIVCVRI